MQQNPGRNVCSYRFTSCLRIETMSVSKTLTQCLFHKCVIDYFYLQQTRCKQHSFLYVLGFGKRFFKNVLFLRIRLKINLSRRFDLYISTPFIVSFSPVANYFTSRLRRRSLFTYCLFFLQKETIDT